jgi:PucR C-terminal helix-turn-helix domain/GGDEF-like domain
MARTEENAAARSTRAAPGVLRLTAGFRGHLDEILDDSVRAMAAEIQFYARAAPATLESVRDHVRLHFEALLESLDEDRDITPEDLLFIRPAATQRAHQGVSLADFTHAFRIGQREIWRALAREASDEETRDAALSIVGHVIEYINVASAHAAEVYLEVEQLLQVQGERVRRDLLGELLEGRPLMPGPRLDAAREAGLGAETECLVITATASPVLKDEHAMRSGASSIARACGGSRPPLIVLRRDELVAVVPTEGRDPGAIGEGLATVQERLGAQGLRLAIAMSTPRSGIEGVPDAYREAYAARERLGPRGGVVALPTMSAFDYVTSIGGESAQRLLSGPVRELVAQDIAEDGVLTETLLAYVAADLNARVAAERLYVHVNTVHYRLGKISERTGCDLRRVPDLLDLLIAIKLARALASEG